MTSVFCWESGSERLSVSPAKIPTFSSVLSDWCLPDTGLIISFRDQFLVSNVCHRPVPAERL